jgi:PAS domain S-box-containing protein
MPFEPFPRWLKQDRTHAVLLLDADGTVIDGNEGVRVVLGYSPDAIAGQPVSALFTPEDRALGLDRHELDTAASVGCSHDDRWQVRGDDTRIWVTGVLTRIADDQGRVIGFVKMLRDRTDLRAEIETLRGRLAGLLGSQETTHAMLATLAHELRNPLAPLKTASQLIARVSQDENVRLAVQIVDRQIALIQRLVDDLMDVGRVQHGKLQLEIRSIEMQAALQDVLEPRRPAAAAHGVELLLVTPPAPILVEADPHRVAQIIANLLDNAIKYTPPGGRVSVTLTVEGDDAVVKVVDTGIGVSSEMLPRIFELFTQESAAQPMSRGGLGIGLALVKSLVDAHGGIVEVRSDGRNKGSQFTVRLPLRQATPRNLDS